MQEVEIEDSEEDTEEDSEEEYTYKPRFAWGEYQTLSPGTHLSNSLKKLCAPLFITMSLYLILLISVFKENCHIIYYNCQFTLQNATEHFFLLPPNCSSQRPV